ncbi:hypothetical protein [Streptomyces sp. NPDC126514]|uniref:NADase-type glycan-binding domain-containing protein n=1 Tax=Streptomyces sp. NPDC126514 TaxID=3155210 RepID=UPI0033166C20
MGGPPGLGPSQDEDEDEDDLNDLLDDDEDEDEDDDDDDLLKDDDEDDDEDDDDLLKDDDEDEDEDDEDEDDLLDDDEDDDVGPSSRPRGGEAAALFLPVRQAPDLPQRMRGPDTGAAELPTADQPEPVLPQAAPKKRAVKPRRTQPGLQPGDKICGECGTGNPPSRKFCKRCGTSLETAEIVGLPWWRRLMPKRKPKTLKAGQRPGQAGVKSGRGPDMSKVLRPLRLILGITFLLLGIAYAVLPPFHNWVSQQVNSVNRKVTALVRPRYDPVRPAEVTASSQLATNQGRLTVDQYNNTYWAAPRAGPEKALTMTFSQPVNLDRALFTNGASDKFADFDRPKDLHLVFSTGKSHDVQLKDQAEPQQVRLKHGGRVTWVEIHVVSTYKSVSGSSVAVTEIEFFSKQRG